LENSAVIAKLDLRTLDPDKVVYLDLGDEDLRENFIEETAKWAALPPFYAVHDGALQVICGRYSDVMEVYLDRDRFSVELPKGPGFERFDKFMGVEQLAQIDGVRHDRLRRIMNPFFGPAAIEGMRDKITAVVDGLIDTIEAGGDEFDAQEDFAAHLMSRVLLNIMCGMDADQAYTFDRLSELIPMASRIPPGGEYPTVYRNALVRTREVITQLIAERAAKPGSDLISALASKEGEEGALTPTELYDQIFTITAAALQSTASSICSVLWALGRNPDQFELVKSDPGLIPAAIDECLRYHGPGFLSFPRFATRDTEVGGTEIKAGMLVRLSQQAACLDAAQFPDPLKVNIQRERRSAPIFGAGVHICLGNRLARFVIGICLGCLIERFPNLRLTDVNFRPKYRGQASETQIAVLPMLTN
jgi:cytochrome P450 RapN